jgi:predicted nucleic acid-binding protein
MYLLDTNVISEVRKIPADRADDNVAAWANQADADLMFLSVVTVRELEHGIGLKERSDPGQGAALRRWFARDVLAGFADRILAIDRETAQLCGRLHVPDPAPERDAFIAATALVNGLSVVTRNTRDFTRFAGLSVLNPWL